MASAATTPPVAVKNLSVWYDASDASTVTTAPGAVSQVTDKSGNGATLKQPTAAAQPPYNANGLNGLHTIAFNGSSNYLYSTTGFPTSSDFTIIYLGKITAAGSNNMFSDFSTNNSTSHAFFGNGAESPTLWTAGSFVTAPSVGTSPFFSVATYNSSTRAGNIYNNGTASPATGTGGSAATDPSIEIGGLNGAASFLTGMLGEALVYSRILTTTERQTVEGYLACKWGLQGNLPGAHPYASSCPIAFTPASLANLSAWYDASDATTVTAGIGVTQWNDKSGSAVNLIAPVQTAFWPALTNNSINGLSALVFNGGQYLYATSGFPISSSYTIVLVGIFTSAATNNVLSSYAASGTSHAFYGNGGTTPTIYQSGNVVIGASVGNSAFLAAGTSQTGTGSVSLYLNGGSATSGTAAQKTITDASIEVGAHGGGANFLKGDIGEAIVYHSVLSTAERQFVEGYLACKWGLQSSLPLTHPYKSTCPSTATANLGLVLAVSPAGSASPGTVLTYTNTFTNSSGTLVYNPVINATVPAHTYFQVGSATNSLGTTGLTASVSYSNDSGATYAYVPASGGGGAPSGYDGNVTNMRWTLTGALGTASSINAGSATYAVIVQ